MYNIKVDSMISEIKSNLVIRTVPIKPLDPNQLREKVINARNHIVISCGTSQHATRASAIWHWRTLEAPKKQV